MAIEMDGSQLVFALACAVLGALALLLIYMAARAGAYDGAKDRERDAKRGKQ